MLVPVYEKGGEHCVVLTKRTQHVEHHKGQICFPGGAYDVEDGDLSITALRETYEEIGVHPGHIEIVGSLDDQVTITSKFCITPFIGIIPYPYEFNFNRWEVEEVIEAPISVLLNPEIQSVQLIDFNNQSFSIYSYRIGDHDITGITAMILKQLLDIVFV